MAKKVSKVESKEKVECNDKFCPRHGKDKIKTRGRVFEGNVVKKLPGRVTIVFDRVVKVPKYERFEKRRTKIHARLTECMNDVEEGDLIQVSETRPISKTIHFIVTQIVRKREDKEQ
jgi:small subunit ribosomal protein S17